MTTELQSQAYNIIPPRRGNGFALTVDSSARVYSLAGIAWGGKTPDAQWLNTGLFLSLINDGTTAIYFRFQSVSTNDMDPTNYVSAGGTIALDNKYACILPPNSYAELRLDPGEDLYLSVKTSSSTSVLRVHASSQPPR